MIELIDVGKVYHASAGDHRALEGVNLRIEDGEFVFIVGESGSGKSTLLKLLMRELTPNEGEIIIDGKDITKLRRKKVAELRRKMGIVFQDYRLLPKRTVYDNVAFALQVIEISPRKIKKSVPAALNLVGLSHKAKSMPNEISGGEQQRTAIARAIVNNPSLVLADEPTGNLDPRNSEEVMEVLEAINMRGTTVVVATHDKDIVNEMQKRVVHLEHGVVVRDSEGDYDDYED